jgi:hypothetical protein
MPGQLVCPRCSSDDIVVNTYTEQKRVGCLMTLLYILLACTILGLLIVIPLVLRGRKTVAHTQCTCKGCGNKWEI